MLKPLVSRFRSDLPVRLWDIAGKQAPAKLKPIVVTFQKLSWVWRFHTLHPYIMHFLSSIYSLQLVHFTFDAEKHPDTQLFGCNLGVYVLLKPFMSNKIFSECGQPSSDVQSYSQQMWPLLALKPRCYNTYDTSQGSAPIRSTLRHPVFGWNRCYPPVASQVALCMSHNFAITCCCW